MADTKTPEKILSEARKDISKIMERTINPTDMSCRLFFLEGSHPDNRGAFKGKFEEAGLDIDQAYGMLGTSRKAVYLAVAQAGINAYESDPQKNQTNLSIAMEHIAIVKGTRVSDSNRSKALRDKLEIADYVNVASDVATEKLHQRVDEAADTAVGDIHRKAANAIAAIENYTFTP